MPSSPQGAAVDIASAVPTLPGDLMGLDAGTSGQAPESALSSLSPSSDEATVYQDAGLDDAEDQVSVSASEDRHPDVTAHGSEQFVTPKKVAKSPNRPSSRASSIENRTNFPEWFCLEHAN